MAAGIRSLSNQSGRVETRATVGLNLGVVIFGAGPGQRPAEVQRHDPLTYTNFVMAKVDWSEALLKYLKREEPYSSEWRASTVARILSSVVIARVGIRLHSE